MLKRTRRPRSSPLIGLLILLPVPAAGRAADQDRHAPGRSSSARRASVSTASSFRIFKFRTMVDGAYKMGSRLTTKRDPRVTRVGQILRWFKIDELPQLINVLLGDMSLIGPRPEDPHFVRFYTAEQRAVLSVRPGHRRPEPDPRPRRARELPGRAEGHRGVLRRAHPAGEARARSRVRRRRASFWGDMALLARGLWATVRGAIKTKFLWRRRRRVALFGVDGVLIVAVLLPGVHDALRLHTGRTIRASCCCRCSSCWSSALDGADVLRRLPGRLRLLRPVGPDRRCSRR